MLLILILFHSLPLTFRQNYKMLNLALKPHRGTFLKWLFVFSAIKIKGGKRGTHTKRNLLNIKLSMALGINQNKAEMPEPLPKHASNAAKKDTGQRMPWSTASTRALSPL